MKSFDNVKLVSSFRQVSMALELISKGIKIFALALIILQAIMLIKDKPFS